MEKDIKPSDIMTRKAFENAIAIIMVLGRIYQCGSSPDCHGKERGCELNQDDFQIISDKIPVLADLKPSGKYLMEDLHQYRRRSGGDEIFISKRDCCMAIA